MISKTALQSLRTHIHRIRGDLDAAEAILAQLADDSSVVTRDPEVIRDPSLFTGRRLSEKGIQVIYALYAAGHTIEHVAAKMGISFSGAASRKRDWLRLNKGGV